MCQNCNRPSCYSCGQFPPPPGPVGPQGAQGLPGPQGPAGPPGPGGTDVWIYAGRFSYTAWQPNGTDTSVVPIATIPAGYVVSQAALEVVTVWGGGGVSFVQFNLTTSPGFSGQVVAILASNPLPNMIRNSLGTTFDRTANYTLTGTVTVFNAPSTINDLTQGEIDIWYKIELLP